MLDESTAFGERAARRLREERLAWLTTVSPSGQPQPVLVWFLWDGDASVLLYSRPDKPKLRNVAENPLVSLHLDGDGLGGDAVVCLGKARVSDDPPADRVPEYVEKYGGFIERNRWTPESFAADYSVPLRIDISRIRGH
jgi:PPOX class probable F420-dependent enzyme